MKIQSVLSVLQIAAILFLASRVMAPGPAAGESAASGRDETVSEAAVVVQAPAESRNLRDYPNENQLRRIVREELAAQLGAITAPEPGPAAADFSKPVSEAEKLYQRDLVEREIAHYASQGTITDLEMQILQGEIAKLDKEGQKMMLGQLVGAINSGELKGRL